MVEVYKENGKIEIATVTHEELQRDRILRGTKELEIKNQKVKISEVPIENNNFLKKLPYSNIKNLLLVELEDTSDFQGEFSLICSKGEYFLAIEKFYFELLNDLYYPRIVSDEVIGELIAIVSPKVELFQYKGLEKERIKTQLTKGQINDLLSYTDREKEAINEFISSIPFLRLRGLFRAKDKKEFYILINEFDKSKVINDFSTNHGTGTSATAEDNGMLLPSNLNKNEIDKPILVLVHGLSSSCRTKKKEIYLALTEYLVPDFHVFTYDYLTINQPISTSGRILANKIKKFKENYRNKEVYIIAHSMGGLVSRSAIEEHEAQVDHLIMAGTPNNGSLLGELPLGKLSLIARTALLFATFNKIKRQDFVDLVYGKLKGLEDLSGKNDYIKNLNEKKLFNHKTYHCIAGNVFRNKTDYVVSVDNMTTVNGEKIPNVILGNWNHFNYFRKDIEESIGKIINTLLKRSSIEV
jgi:hypothetical protein